MTEQEKERGFDEKGHLPETDVPNKGELHVHPGQIIDKGGSTNQVRQGDFGHHTAARQIARVAKPTGSDDRRARDPQFPNPNPGDVPDDQRPEKIARQQSQELTDLHEEHKSSLEESRRKLMEQSEESGKPLVNLDDSEKVFNKPNDPFGQDEHRILAGIDDGAIPGARTGNPLEMIAEKLMGDKVHDVVDNHLKVQTKDKSRAVHALGSPEGETVKRVKVSLLFPGINPHVAQRQLSIYVDGLSEPWFRAVPPDVPNIEILLPLDKRIHIELVHVDQEGKASRPYILDFYTNPKVAPRPLEASPLGYEIMEEVLVKTDLVQQEEKEEESEEKPKVEESKADEKDLLFKA